MGMTYFKRYRMEFDLRDWNGSESPIPDNYEILPFQKSLVRDHAVAKYSSFREEMDANVFPCLSKREGCLRLMQEIANRRDFVSQATWLIRYRDGSPIEKKNLLPGETGLDDRSRDLRSHDDRNCEGQPTGRDATYKTIPVGTIQGLAQDGWGAIQNLGIDPLHRGKGLGSILLARAAMGFRAVGLNQMHLEVTTENTGAVRLYERLGFKRANVVYKATEIAGARV